MKRHSLRSNIIKMLIVFMCAITIVFGWLFYREKQDETRRIKDDEYGQYIVELNEVNIVTRKLGTMKLRSSVMNEDMISSAELSRAACCNLGESFVTNPSVDVSYSDAATGGMTVFRDNTTAPMVHFLSAYMSNKSITNDDLKFLNNGYRLQAGCRDFFNIRIHMHCLCYSVLFL